MKATNQIKANFVFRLFIFFPGFRTKSAKKACLRFATFNCSKKLQNIFKIGLKKCGVIIQKSLLEKKYFELSSSQTCFSCLTYKLQTYVWELLISKYFFFESDFCTITPHFFNPILKMFCNFLLQLNTVKSHFKVALVISLPLDISPSIC